MLDTGIDANHPDLMGLVDRNRSTSFLDDAASVCRPGEPGTPSTTVEHDEARNPRVSLGTLAGSGWNCSGGPSRYGSSGRT